MLIATDATSQMWCCSVTSYISFYPVILNSSHMALSLEAALLPNPNGSHMDWQNLFALRPAWLKEKCIFFYGCALALLFRTPAGFSGRKGRGQLFQTDVFPSLHIPKEAPISKHPSVASTGIGICSPVNNADKAVTIIIKIHTSKNQKAGWNF